MSVFLGMSLKKNVAKGMRLAGSVVFLSIVFVCLAGIGCKRKAAPVVEPELPHVFTNRMADVTYVEALKENMGVQRQWAGERSEVVEKMTAMIERTRAALPEGASDEAVKAELDKSAEWRELEAQNARLIGEIEKTLAQARETVRQRMLAEANDLKAVAEGRAIPAQPPERKIP